MSKEIFHTVSYKINKSSAKWKRAYIKPIYSETLLIPVILRYELYKADKKTLIRSYAIHEAEKALADGLIVKAQDLKLNKLP